MKSRLIIVLGIIVLTLAACGNNNDSDEIVSSNEESVDEVFTEDTDEEKEDTVVDNDGVFELYPDGGTLQALVLGTGDDFGVTPVIQVEIPMDYRVNGITYVLGDVPAIEDRTYLGSDYVGDIDLDNDTVHNSVITGSASVYPQMTFFVYEGNLEEFYGESDLSSITENVNGYDVVYEFCEGSGDSNTYEITIEITSTHVLNIYFENYEITEDGIEDFVDAVFEIFTVIE